MVGETRAIRENLTTLRDQLAVRKCDEGLVEVIDSIALAGKAIAAKVRRARIEDVIGAVGSENLHGEEQQKLDVISNDLLVHTLSRCTGVAFVASEEEDDVIVLRPSGAGGRYGVLFDPLDGSSNIDVAVSVGTIFSILPNDASDDATEQAALQPGTRQVAAGYILYGSSVCMMVATDGPVDMFVLDPHLGEFVLVKEGVQLPDAKKIYSLNEAYVHDLPEGYRAYLDWAHRSGYSSRYIGSMVADVHRTLLKGGVFLYPPTTKSPNGKLRLMYEANPMALLVERAGGVAAAGRERILEIRPGELHQRTSVVLGSRDEVEAVTRQL